MNLARSAFLDATTAPISCKTMTSVTTQTDAYVPLDDEPIIGKGRQPQPLSDPEESLPDMEIVPSDEHQSPIDPSHTSLNNSLTTSSLSSSSSRFSPSKKKKKNKKKNKSKTGSLIPSDSPSNNQHVHFSDDIETSNLEPLFSIIPNRASMSSSKGTAKTENILINRLPLQTSSTH